MRCTATVIFLFGLPWTSVGISCLFCVLERGDTTACNENKFSSFSSVLLRALEIFSFRDVCGSIDDFYPVLSCFCLFRSLQIPKVINPALLQDFFFECAKEEKATSNPGPDSKQWTAECSAFQYPDSDGSKDSQAHVVCALSAGSIQRALASRPEKNETHSSPPECKRTRGHEICYCLQCTNAGTVVQKACSIQRPEMRCPPGLIRLRVAYLTSECMFPVANSSKDRLNYCTTRRTATVHNPFRRAQCKAGAVLFSQPNMNGPHGYAEDALQDTA